MNTTKKPKIIGNPYFLTDEKAQARHNEVVDILNDLIQKRCCTITEIAKISGIQQPVLSDMYRNVRVVSERNLSRLKAVYDKPISQTEIIDSLIKEINDLKGQFDEIKEMSRQAVEMSERAEQVLQDNHFLLQTINRLQEKLNNAE
ncbi:MAG: hypothetical protein IJ759_07870 [Bacteroidales bacterium]|nr:hypothetical protein [Bacteroidales bacterium]MBR1775421.1 hypothetical protein [Bacteroidales bacterium]